MEGLDHGPGQSRRHRLQILARRRLSEALVHDLDRTAEAKVPISAQIASDIRHRIECGELAPGDRVPSTRKITNEWGVAMATATKALKQLRREGVVEPIPGVGTVVSFAYCGAEVHRPEKSPRSRHHGQTFADIVRTAIGIADTHGLHTLSTRRLARSCAISTTSLYRYIANRDQLLFYMADTVFGEERPTDLRPGSWRERFEWVAYAQWRIYTRHSWVAPVVSARTDHLLIPNAMQLFEWALEGIHEFELDPHSAVGLVTTLGSYVLGASLGRSNDLAAIRGLGTVPGSPRASDSSALHRAFRTGRFPNLEAMYYAQETTLDPEASFEFGLQRQLDGISRFLANERLRQGEAERCSIDSNMPTYSMVPGTKGEISPPAAS